MSPLRIVLTIAFIVSGIILAIVIMKQESKHRGLSGALTGSGGGNTDSYWAKNQSRSAEGRLVIWSRVFMVIFSALGVILNIKAI